MMNRSNIKTAAELDMMREAAGVSTQILDELRKHTHIGVKPTEINDLAGELCAKHSVVPAFKDVKKPGSVFGGNLCLSVNDAVLHGRPFSEEPFNSGDLVKLDFGIIHKGYYTDQCVTVGLGEVSEEDTRLVNIGKFAVQSALKQAVTGNATGDIGNVIQTIAESAGFNVLKEYVGHSIGRSLWEDPQVPPYGKKGAGDELKSGMVLCIEAQIVAGSDETYVDDDKWTIYTEDGKKGVMFEYMVVVGDSNPELLTKNLDWPVFAS